MALSLSHFSATGTIHMQMRVACGLFTRGNGQVNLWASTGWTNDGADGQVGTLEEGSAAITGIAGNAPTLTRFARWSSLERLILNTDGAGNIGELFDQTTDVSRLSVVIETSTGHVLWTLPNPSTRGGGSFVDWRGSEGDLTDAMWTVLSAIAAGDEVILAVHQGVASYTPPLDADGTLTGGLAGSISAAASIGSATPLDAAGTLDGGLAGSIDAAASIASPTPLDANGTLDGGLAGSLSGAASIVSPTPLDADGTLNGGLSGSLSAAASIALPTTIDASGTLDGGLAGSLSGAASIVSPVPLDADGTLDGGLTGSLSADASLAYDPLDAAGTLDGGLAGSLSAAASVASPTPLDAAGTLDGGLAGSLSAVASLSLLPLDAAGTLDGGLAGSLEGDANLADIPIPPRSLRECVDAVAEFLRDRMPDLDITSHDVDVHGQVNVLAGGLVLENGEWSREISKPDRPLRCRHPPL